MALVIGLTGGIACGKSTVSAYLRQKGISVIDADLVAREVVELGTMGLQQIKEVFGWQYICSGWYVKPTAFREKSICGPGSAATAKRHYEAAYFGTTTAAN